jgi:hypothetical protein
LERKAANGNCVAGDLDAMSVLDHLGVVAGGNLVCLSDIDGYKPSFFLRRF